MRTFILLSLVLALASQASDYSLIVRADSPVKPLSESEVRDLFLYKRHYSHEQKIIPINLLADNETRKAFESDVLKMDRRKLNAYWVKQHFKGVSPPVTQASYNAVIRFVTKVQGAIGYIPSSMADASVKVIYEF